MVADVPLPTDCADVEFPYAVVKPYSKFACVESPLGLTRPFTVAEVVEMLLAALVVAVGDVQGVALVGTKRLSEEKLPSNGALTPGKPNVATSRLP